MRVSLIAVLVSAAMFAPVLGQAPASVLDGVYTKEQAERGHAAYERYCHQCHEGLENDGPDLTNKAFLDRWREDSLAPLFTFIRTTMPGTAPGSLDDRVYADLIAFMLEAQELPAGKTELAPEMIGRIQLVGPGGPAPLANLTIVRAVGCLSAAANDTWTLTRASSPRPVRSRIVSGTTPEELSASAAQALGTETFPLMSVKAQSASLTGHKVQVKGVLTRQKTLERINVMSLDSVGPACGG
jgi:S-disulfanyl-L-cysteine oxidoreductase SoxD